MRIAAVADIHSPRYFTEFRNSLSECSQPDLFLLAGDMINHGKVHEYQKIIDAIDSHSGQDTPIIACFGNEEREEDRDDILNLVEGRIQFLDEQSITLNLQNETVGIAGASTLAPNQRPSEDRTIREMRRVFEKRAKRLSRLLDELAKNSTHTILLVHYSPLIEITRDDDSETFSWWVSKTVENTQPDWVIHGHIHNSTKLEVKIGNTRVVNVAYPAARIVTELQF